MTPRSGTPTARSAPADGLRLPGFGGRLGDGLAVWADWVRRFAMLVVAAALVATIAAGIYTARNLGVQTARDAMFAEDLPFLKQMRQYEAAFPALIDPLVVVIDAPTPEQAERAAAALAERMRADPQHFRSVFFPEGDAFFRRNGFLFLALSDLEALSADLATAQPVLATLAADPGMASLLGVLARGARAIADGDAEPQTMAAVLPVFAKAVAAASVDPHAAMSWQAFMGGDLARQETTRKLLIAQPIYDHTSLQPAAGALAAVRSMTDALDLRAQGVSVRLTGNAALEEEELQSVEAGIGLASAISFVLVTLVSFVGLRSLKLVLATIAALVMSLSWTAAFAAAAIGHLNLISVAFGVLFIGLAVDFSIQLAMRYREEREAGRGHAASLRAASRGSGVAVSLAAIAASIGFFAFVPTDFTGLAELGIIAGVGMLIGLFSTLTLLPALFTVLKPRPGGGRIASAPGTRLGLWLVAHPRTVVLAAIGLGVGALATLPFSRFDIDPINLKDPRTELVRTFWDLARDAETSPYSINIVAPDIETARRLAERLDKLPEVERTMTAASFLPEDQDDKLALIEQMQFFLWPVLDATPPPAAVADPEKQRQAIDGLREALQALLNSGRAGELAAPAQALSRALAPYATSGGADAQALAALDRALLLNLPGQIDRLRDALGASKVTLAALPPALRERYIAAGGEARIEVFPRDRATDIDNLRRFVDAVRTIAPNATDTSVMLLEAGHTMVDALRQAGIYALVLISLLLLLILRSIVDAVLVLIPLFLASLLTTASGVLFNIPFNFANIIAVPLLFSLGVAFGIYLVLRGRETPNVDALMRTSTPRAVVFSALMTMVSFGSLMVSDHRGTASMGELLTLSLTFAVACTVIVLPALLAWREQGWTLRPREITPTEASAHSP